MSTILWTHPFVSYNRYIQDPHIILKDGDILITKDGSIGKVAYVEGLNDKRATLNNGIFRIRVDSQYSKFIFYTFLSLRFKDFLDKLAGGSSIVHLYQKDFEKYEIVYPTILEQKKSPTVFLLLTNSSPQKARSSSISKATKKV